MPHHKQVTSQPECRLLEDTAAKHINFEHHGHIRSSIDKHFLFQVGENLNSLALEESTELFNLNFQSLEVVSRYRDPQLQVTENL